MNYRSYTMLRLPARLASLFCILAVGLGLLAFIGWISGISWLSALWPGGIPMAPSTASLFLLFGGVLLLLIHFPHPPPALRFSRLFAWMATVLSCLLLVFSSLGIHLRVEFLGMNISGRLGGVPVGHMSPLTALCFMIVGASLLLQYHDGRRIFLSFWVAAGSFLIALILIVGYLVGAPLLYGTGIIPPAMTTSLAFLLLSLALLFSIGLKIWPHDSVQDDTSAQATAVLTLVFMLVVTAILSAGYLYSRNMQKHFHQQAEAELAAIADLKINELQQWRRERLWDASVFFKNAVFSGLVTNFFKNPDDMADRAQLGAWLEKLQENSGYDRVFLVDLQGTERFSVPENHQQQKAAGETGYVRILGSRRIAFLDFHRDPFEQKPHLDVAVPVLSGPGWEKATGLLILQIDPQRYLYPLIRRWPVPSETAESLLVRRDGDDVQFLNQLRYKKDAALTLHFPLTAASLPAVMAVRGREGIVQGIDYRGEQVVAAIRTVPDSPWFLVAKMDLDEVNRPLYQRLIWITILIGTLLLGAGGIIGFVWRNHRAQFYRLKYLAAQAAEDSEKRLMLIFEGSKDGIMVAEAESKRIIVANRAVSELLGYSHEELLTLGVGDIHPPEELPAIVKNFERQARAEISIAADMPMKRKDGSVFYADINTTPIEYGGRACLLGTFRDVTDRMLARARIERLNRVLRTIRNINQLIIRAKTAEELIRSACNLLVDHASYGSALIILTDSDGAPIGHMEAGVGGDFLLLVEQMDRGELPECCKAADTVDGVCLIRGHGDICETCPIGDQCVSPRKMSVRLRHQDTVYGYLSVGLDRETEMDSEEERLFVELAGDLAYALHNMEMKKTVQVAEQETKRLEAQLIQSQKMEAVGQLAGGVAHDFNNLLTIILGYSQMIGEEMGAGSGSGEAIKEIHDAAIRAKNLTRQLLAFGRKQMLEMHVVDVNQVVKGFEKLIRRTIGEDIRMELLLTPDQTWVKADISQLEQILMNLAVNARDAMPDGGVLTIETACMDLDESYTASRLGSAPGPHVMISVNDTGSGMDHETVERIFEPFYTTKPLGRGTGLGLSTVYGVVKQHGGNIWVYSEPGRGTTFKVYLPSVAQEIPEEQQRPKVQQPVTKGLSVLVVEDEPSLMKLARRVLERSGYQVHAAGDAEDAVEFARTTQAPIHLLLTDVIMPKMKGTEVFGKVIHYHPEIRVLYMSGYTENVIARQGILQEGIHFLQKPFSARSLLEKVSETLGS